MSRFWTKFLLTLGYLYVSGPLPVRWEHAVRLRKLVRPGDVLAGTAGTILRWFTPGPYVHTAFVVDADRVVEAVGEGVLPPHPVEAFVMEERIGVALWRPRYPEPREERVRAAAEKALSLVGKPYDFGFRPDIGRLYCHELTALCLEAGGLRVERVSPARIVTASEIRRQCDEVWTNQTVDKEQTAEMKNDVA